MPEIGPVLPVIGAGVFIRGRKARGQVDLPVMLQRFERHRRVAGGKGVARADHHGHFLRQHLPAIEVLPGQPALQRGDAQLHLAAGEPGNDIASGEVAEIDRDFGMRVGQPHKSVRQHRRRQGMLHRQRQGRLAGLPHGRGLALQPLHAPQQHAHLAQQRLPLLRQAGAVATAIHQGQAQMGLQIGDGVADG